MSIMLYRMLFGILSCPFEIPSNIGRKLPFEF